MEDYMIAIIAVFIIVLISTLFFGGQKLSSDAGLEEVSDSSTLATSKVMNHTLMSHKILTPSNPEGIEIPPGESRDITFNTPEKIKVSKQFFDGEKHDETHTIRKTFSKLHLTNSGVFTNLNSDENVTIRNPFNKIVKLVETSGTRRWEHGVLMPGASITIPALGYSSKLSFVDNLTENPIKEFIYGR